MSAVTKEMIDAWADEKSDIVALHLKQKLLPVEGEGAVIFPPTYADIGYNIDTLSDGTKVCTIDSVGAQANRMEPIFKRDDLKHLVPQIEIEISRKGESPTFVSLLDLPHRSADSVVHSSPTLAPSVASAFKALRKSNDAWPLCCIAPTSLVFGVWDSRGGSGEKRPRIVRSTIRAWNVEPLSAAAQFNSVWKLLDDEQREALEKEAKAKKTKLSEKGFADAPAIFRKVSASAAKQMTEFRNGSPNPERRVLGGVRVLDRIEREVTINLVALRRLCGQTPEDTAQVRRYILSLALIAGSADIDMFLRSGCQFSIETDTDEWTEVPKRGQPSNKAIRVDLAELTRYANAAASPFREKWPEQLTHKFDVDEAKKLLAKKDEGEEVEAN